jgi:hypothetical protein
MIKPFALEFWAPFYRSNTVRALLVAFVAWALTAAGVAEEASSAEAQKLVNLFLELVQGVALAWGVYARTRQPTPALTLTKAKADERNEAAIAEAAEINKETPPPAAT